MKTLTPHVLERRDTLQAEADRLTVLAGLASGRGDQRGARDLTLRVQRIKQQIKDLTAR